MYCPKCGSENPETNQYCRGCRESLQVIAQALKGHLPVVIGSKVDQILDSKSERFRRDSLLRLLMSLLVLTGCLLSWKNGYNEHKLEFWYLLVAAIALAWAALFEYRAYKRSLSPDFDWAARDQGQESLSYRLGRFVGRVSRLLSKRPTNVPVISLGPARSRTTRECLTGALGGERFASVSIPSITESTTRELDSSNVRSSSQSTVIYCPKCGRAGDRGSNRCDDCGVSLDLVAQAIQRLEPDQRTARLDRFIRRRTAALEDASRSLRPLYWVPSVVMAICLIATSSLALTMPLWWYNLGLFFFLLVSGAWDLVAYRRTAPERRFPLQSSTLQMNLTDPQPRVEDWERFSRDGRVLRINDATLGMIDAGERRPIREWQQQHPGLWMLIEVTLEEEWGASEGKLIATAKDYAEFDELYVSYSDRYLLAVYGKR